MSFLEAVAAFCFLRQFGQYQGAGVLTGFGLHLRRSARRKRLPFTAVLGGNFFPVLLCSSTSEPPSVKEWSHNSAIFNGTARAAMLFAVDQFHHAARENEVQNS